MSEEPFFSLSTELTNKSKNLGKDVHIQKVKILMTFFELRKIVPNVYQMPCAYTACGLAKILFSNYPSFKEESSCSYVHCKKHVFQKCFTVVYLLTISFWRI